MDRPKAVLDVSLYHPLIRARRVDEEPNLFDGVLRSASGPKTIRGWAEPSLEDRLQHQLGRLLDDPVAQGGNAQLSDLPRPALRDLLLAHRQRRVATVPERLTKLAQDPFHANLLDASAGFAINPRGFGPPVAFHPLPRDEQRRGVADQVKQVAEASLLVSDCPAVQPGLPSQYPLRRYLHVKRRERVHARPPERPLVPRPCCPPSPCTELSSAPTTMRPPTRPAPTNRHRALPGCHQQPGARGAFPAFTMIRLTGSAAGCTPTALPTGTRSLPSATTPRISSQAQSEPPPKPAASWL